jgi:prephenate dehydratase
MKVAFQGEPGAYGHEAIDRYFGDPSVTAVAMSTFLAVYEAVASAEVDAAVLPLENSLAGTVGDALDVLATGSLVVVGEVLQPVDHHLLVLPGVGLLDVETVTSHWQALAQCDRFLSRHHWGIVPAADTAGAARQLARDGDRRTAAIASERAAALYGLEVAARHIQTAPHNVTRFAVLARSRENLVGFLPRAVAATTAGYETLVTFETGHQPGDLVRALTVLADAGINLSRIESRPSGEGPWRYRFLVQVGGDADVDPLRSALAAMRSHTRSLRVLGSFVAG